VYTQTPFQFRFRSMRFAPPARASWLWLVPGISLILLALAIVIWPELLAYLVAGAIMTAGIVLTVWGWAMRQATRQPTQQVEYRVYPGDPF
jgi:predicted lysophospholipase L1 biosynthesis ABC-type transport system permease subunit